MYATHYNSLGRHNKTAFSSGFEGRARVLFPGQVRPRERRQWRKRTRALRRRALPGRRGLGLRREGGRRRSTRNVWRRGCGLWLFFQDWGTDVGDGGVQRE